MKNLLKQKFRSMSVLSNSLFRNRNEFIFLCILVAGFQENKAVAVWAHSPPCSDEQGSADSKKVDLNNCIVKINIDRQGASKIELNSVNDREIPCASELKNLLMKQEELRICLERFIWWIRKK